MSNNSLILFNIVIFLTSFLLTLLIRKFAIKKSIIDIPNERSSHQIPTPRGGGFAIIITIYAGLTYLYCSNKIEEDLFFALLPGIGLSLVGFYDDIKKLNWLIRLGIQFLCSMIALVILRGMKPLVGNDINIIWSLGALLGMIWFINLYNFLDGSDGYSSMETIAVSIFLWYFSGSNTLLVIAFSVAGFIYWNWPSAKIFMGDAGSTTLGFILAVIGIYFHNTDELNLFYWLMLTALFWFDATFTILRRMKYNEKITEPHKNHIYQRLIRGGTSHLKVMLLGLSINIILFIICYITFIFKINIVVGILIMIAVFSVFSYYVEIKYPYRNGKRY